MFVNVQSLVANHEKIELLLHECVPKLFVCTEARVTDAIQDNEISIAGYKIIKSPSSTRNSGGVVVYVKENILVRVICNWCELNDNIIVFYVENSSCRGYWVAVYHSPNSDHCTFMAKLKELYDIHVTGGSNAVCCGDLNIDIKSGTLSGIVRNALTAFQVTNNLSQIVKRFTRVTQHSKTLIDHCYTNNPRLKAKVVDEPRIADHKLVALHSSHQERNYFKVVSFDRSKCTKERIQESFRAKILNVDSISVDLNDRFHAFLQKMEETMNELVTRRYVTPNYSKRWFTQELRQLRTEESIKHNRAVILNDNDSWQQYRSARNEYNRALKRAKRNHIQSVIENCKDDRKLLWKELKKLTSDKNTTPDYVKFGDEYVSDKTEIANRLNDYFISSIAEINASIPQVTLNLSHIQDPLSFFEEFTPTTVQQITDILSKMKSKAGINNVNKDTHMCLIPECGQIMAELINESLASGRFPEALKFTVVTPIPKIKTSIAACDMRPINNAHTFDKLIQTVVKIQLQDHVERNDILSPNQSAYRQHHSCETALNLVLIDWKQAFENKKVVVAVFCDFKRAFETIDREILIEILSRYGVRGTVLRWFQTWLSGRKQYTRFGDAKSAESENNFGVPQGTPLSCLLFILYINCIVNIPKFCKIALFADDTLIWIVADNLQDAIRMINSDLNLISEFLRMLRLKINVLKTKAMIINARGQTSSNIIIDDQPIEIVNTMKYLGIMVDYQLTFNENIEYMVKKIAKKVSLLARIRDKIDRETSVTLFKTIVSPHLDYCSSVLLLATEAQIHQLQLLMNKALRVIEKANRRTHIHDMLVSTDLLDVKQRIYYNILMLIFRTQNHLLPEYICKHFQLLSQSQPYQLRNNNHLRPPSFTSTASQNSFMYKGSLIYNDMIRRCRVDSSASETEYRKAIKQYVKSYVASHRLPQ